MTKKCGFQSVFTDFKFASDMQRKDSCVHIQKVLYSLIMLVRELAQESAVIED
jgi:hypothetical protein